MRSFVECAALDSSLPAQLGESGVVHSAAERRADKSFSANVKAISESQPHAALAIVEWKISRKIALSEFTFLFGRDGSLTARDAQGAWCAGTSLPYRVGQSLMNSLELNGEVGCLLAPSTAGLIRAALEKIAAHQALVAVLPDEIQVLVALHSGDFSTDIAAGRLWIAAGESWTEELAAVFDANPGLCVPRQYVRTGLQPDAEVGGLIALANPVFTAVNERRAKSLAGTRHLFQSGVSQGRIRVVAGSSFTLADPAGPALAELLCARSDNWPRLDVSRPVSASPLALAEAAKDCGAIVAADLFRRDMPGSVPDELPFVTWVTRPRIPPPVSPADHDALLIADTAWRKQALAAGWPAGRIFAAAWPSLCRPIPPSDGPAALIADAIVCDMPERLKDFSSHAVLWEQIAAELDQNPLTVGDCTDDYLSERLAQLEIDPLAVDRTLFTQKMILPAWRRGVARMLIEAGVPLVIYGAGWDAAEFAAIWRGPIASLDELRRAASPASALVHPDPAAGAHAVHALARPVVLPRSLLKNSGRIAPVSSEGARLSEKIILSVLR